MLEGTAALKAAEGAGQGYGEDVCFRLGQVYAGTDEAEVCLRSSGKTVQMNMDT